MDGVQAGHNQSVFRELNERIRGLDYSLPAVCECARPDCRQIVPISSEEYEEIRRSPNLFIVAPGNAHIFRNIERLYETRPTYWVVEKFGESAFEANRLDPRNDAVL